MPNTSGNQLEVDDIYAIGEERSRRRSSCKEPISYTNRAIDRFTEAINAMNEAVLVPSKLKDIEVSESDSTEEIEFEIAPKTDLYQYYAMLNNVKDDIYNGLSIGDEILVNGTNNGTNHSTCSNNNVSNGRWDRQQSDEAFNSLTSFSSLSASLDGEPVSFEDRANQLMSVFMQHLQSLYGILQHFTKAAEYITKRYQDEIERTADKWYIAIEHTSITSVDVSPFASIQLFNLSMMSTLLTIFQ